jgi:hypothetical protein
VIRTKESELGHETTGAMTCSDASNGMVYCCRSSQQLDDDFKKQTDSKRQARTDMRLSREMMTGVTSANPAVGMFQIIADACNHLQPAI